MKHLNILSLTQAYGSLQKESFIRFLHHYEIEVKDQEIKDLTILADELHKETCDIKIFNQFYVAYKIPQISKEFDLLRIGEECIVNIELKKTSTEDKIKKQLIRNKYYLGHIGIDVKLFSFVSDTKQLYHLDDNNNITKVNISYLVSVLIYQNKQRAIKIDNLFDPSAYLTSPFNSTDKFIKDEYFLTNHQDEVKEMVLNITKDDKAANFISITGSAGTGKTLLVYDIAKELSKIKKKVLIIHCGNLNEGHDKLVSKYGWEIIPIKYYSKPDLSKYDVLIIDEAQRMQQAQLNNIIERIISTNAKCVFSYDKAQTLAIWEEHRNIDEQISNINSIVSFKLTEKIRTNKEIANFINLIFNNKAKAIVTNKGNINIDYFVNIDDAKAFIDSLDTSEWEVLRFTPSQFNNEHHEKYSNPYSKASHGVIGQEFDNVVVIIDRLFFYKENGNLSYKGKVYYHPVKMLFQNITRTRKKLNVVIIDNEAILNRCVSVLQ